MCKCFKDESPDTKKRKGKKKMKRKITPEPSDLELSGNVIISDICDGDELDDVDLFFTTISKKKLKTNEICCSGG